MVESVAIARDQREFVMPATSYDVGGYRLHLNCAGTGSPTVVLENGLGETSPVWDRITSAAGRTTRDRQARTVATPKPGRQTLGHWRFSAASGLFQPQLAPSALNLIPVPGADNGREMLMALFIGDQEADGRDPRPTRPSCKRRARSCRAAGRPRLPPA